MNLLENNRRIEAMNFLKRSFQYSWDKKGKTLLMIAIFSAILIFVLAGLTIQSATELATKNAQKSMGATVTLQQNRESMFKKDDDNTSETSSKKGGFELTPIALEDAKNIGALSDVASYYFEAKTSVDASEGIEAVSSSDDLEATTSTDTEGQEMPGGGDGGPGGMAMMSSGDFQISGVSTLAANSSFEEETATIIDGEGITADDEGTNNVVIETTLAEANDLAVGDTFKVTNSEDEDVEVSIRGIYETSETGDSMGMQFNFMNPVNTIYSSYTLANDLAGADEGTLDSATYTLSDPENMEAFVEEANQLIDTDTFSLQTNDQMYQQMLTPISNVSKFSKNIVILVGIAGVVILTLIVMLSIRERRYEIGVLLSLGESRIKLISQFFVEMVVCMLVAVVIAGASGNVIGNVVGNQLLEQQSSQTTSTEQGSNQNGGPGGQMSQPGEGQGGGGPGGQQGGGMMDGTNLFTSSESISELEVKTSMNDIMKLLGLGILICLLSILLSSASILKMNPKKILIG